MQIKGRMAAGTAGAKGWRAEKGTARSFHGMTFYAASPPRAVPRAVGGGGHRARGAAWASCGILLRFAVFAVLAVATAAAAMGDGFMMAVREPEAVLAGGGAATHRSLDAVSVSKAGALGRSLPPRTRPSHSRPALAPRPPFAPETPVDTYLATRLPLGAGGGIRTAPAREDTAPPRRPARLGVGPPVRDGDPPD